MNQQTPIHRHQALVPLSQDHHFALLLVWKIKQGLNRNVGPERISRYVLYFFNEELQRHFAEEEKYLFTKLSPEDPLRIQAEADHTDVRVLVETIKTDTLNRELLLRFADALQKHIRFEERTLFNHIQSSLPENLASITEEQNTVARKDIDEVWDDVFWGNDKSSL